MIFVITGANRGLGYSLTSQALQQGHRVLAAVRSVKRSEESMKPLIEAYGDTIELMEWDGENDEDAGILAEGIRNRGLQVDVLINNAAVLLGRDQKLEKLNLDNVRKSFQINTIAPMNVTKHILPLMPDNQDSVIVNISSEAGSIAKGWGGDYAYAISKTALNMFSKELKEYVKERGIRVYAFHPGWMQTDMGGEQAPGNPDESAAGILEVIANSKSVPEDVFFLDHKGKPFPL